MRVGGRSDIMIALSLGRCKPFLMMPSCDCRVSVATGTSKLQVQSLPLCPESDGQSSKCGLSRWPEADVRLVVISATLLPAPSLSTFANKKPNDTEGGHRIHPPCTDGKLHNESCDDDKR